MSAAPRFALDPSVRRRDGGKLLVGGVPPRLLRLTETGAASLDAILAGGPLDPPATALARRLDRAGLIHPLPDTDAVEPEVTTIIPALDGGETLLAIVRVALTEGPVIVVD